MKVELEKTARRPVSYDTEPCEGRQASPSNPNPAAKPQSETELTERMIFRCTLSDKARIIALAQNSGSSVSEIFREALGLAKARRLRPVPSTDPALLRQLAGIGNNLNQIARCLNHEARMGGVAPLDALALAAELVTIERTITNIMQPTTKMAASQVKETK